MIPTHIDGPISGTFNADGFLSCGCRIKGLSIAWCPTHAQAEAMRSLCKDISLTWDDECPRYVVDTARAILRAVEE